MAYYMANAREHFDQGFQLTYGNPYAGYNTPAIYFQPHILVLGLLEHLGLDPALAFNLFGLAAVAFATWIAVRFYREAIGLETRAKRLALVVFFWGGGLLFLAGLVWSIAHGHSLQDVWRFDIADGWWMLNFGRNLVYPTEAYYHGLFLLALLFVLRRNTIGALATAALLSASHPFTGLSLALILLAYSSVGLFHKSEAAPRVMAVGAALLVIAHLSYYWVFLNRFADHRVLRDQWQIPWLYMPSTFVPALCFVGGLTALTFLYRPGYEEALRDRRNRLFLVWFLVVFALSQHHLFVKPFQPIHFTHGYDWMALFFLAAPLLVSLFERLLAVNARALRVATLGLVLTLLLSDNVAWIGQFLTPGGGSGAIVLTRDQKDVLEWLDRNAAPPAMVVCDDPLVSYLVSTYTSIRSWRGHRFNTPYSAARQAEVENAFQKGQILPDWERRPVFYVSNRKGNWRAPGSARELYRNGGFTIWSSPAIHSEAGSDFGSH
jgi:hypothetical protein